MTAVVKYQIATYSGEITVLCEQNDENEVIIAKAKRILTRQAKGLPFGYENWKIVDRY